MLVNFNIHQPNNNFLADKKEKLPAESSNVISDEKLNKNREKNKSGKAITIATIAAVSSGIILSRGFQKNANKFLNKVKEKLEKRAAVSTQKGANRKKSFYEFSIRRINSFIRKSESINNITSLKDILFMKLMYKTKPTKSIHMKISEYFEKISQKTVYDSYKKTGKLFDKMYKTFDKLDESILRNSPDEIVEFKGKKYTKKELVEMARSNRDTIKIVVNAFINKSTIQARYQDIKDVTSSLYSTFWDASFKDFWSKNNKFKNEEMWQTFIAAEQVRGDKTKLATRISYARNVLTFSKNDWRDNILGYIHAIDSVLPVNDKEGIEIIKKLETYVKNREMFQKNTALFRDEIEKLKKHKLTYSSYNRMEQVIEDYKKTNIKLIEEQITETEPGVLQDMLEIYDKIAHYELEKSGALSSARKAVKSFDDSVETECVDFFDKVRDLQLGSAPTDVLTILFSFIALSYGLGHTQDKDKKISLMLKSGIPVVGGIAASVYSATKLVSGGKSLAFGFLSGIVLYQLGIIADNMRKKYAEQKLVQS